MSLNTLEYLTLISKQLPTSELLLQTRPLACYIMPMLKIKS